MRDLSSLRPLSFGARPTGDRLARIERSPHYDRAAGRFANPEAAPDAPRATGTRGQMMRALLRTRGRKPAGAIPLERPDLSAPPASGLRLTWLGHATVLAEIDGRRVLFDPVWGRRCSPFSFVGPKRLHPAPVPLSALGPLDAVVVSHDHYDHLDLPTIRALARSGARFAVPLGVGAHLERWGVPAARVDELDWHESAEVAGLTLTATPARHFCGRGLRDAQRALWASWTVAGPEHRVFHSGDTGYFPGFADIGGRYGPFDATMIQIGAYSEAFWPDIHMTPEEGVRAHLDLTRAEDPLLPIHWGTFNLALHPWAEPAERTLRAAAAAGVRAAAPVPGGSFEPSAEELPTDPWWRAVAAATGAGVSRRTAPAAGRRGGRASSGAARPAPAAPPQR
ncbi:MBL fold metallo-hydrolase [Streptomyces albiaxialis]|uniref:MBL fold metallo-hydrolase n=1 Tax=Streptomyces albiaxialis TaxID=329523 RepID=A0ABP5IAB6_9ACTN